MFPRRRQSSETTRMLEHDEIRQLVRARRALLLGLMFFIGCILVGLTPIGRLMPAELWGLNFLHACLLIYVIFPIIVACALCRWAPRKQAFAVFIVLLPALTCAEAIAARFDRNEILPSEWWQIILPMNLVLSAVTTAMIYYYDAVGRIDRHRNAGLDDIDGERR